MFLDDAAVSADMPGSMGIMRHVPEVTGRPVSTTYHPPAEYERTADASTYRDGSNVMVTPTCAESHFASQDGVHIVVADYRTGEQLAEMCRQRGTLEKLEFGLQPDDLARCEVDPA